MAPGIMEQVRQDFPRPSSLRSDLDDLAEAAGILVIEIPADPFSLGITNQDGMQHAVPRAGGELKLARWQRALPIQAVERERGAAEALAGFAGGLARFVGRGERLGPGEEWLGQVDGDHAGAVAGLDAALGAAGGRER